jgi:hypothetical protein
MPYTHLGVGGLSFGLDTTIADKAPAGYPALGILITEFDLWVQDYAGAIVNVLRAGTTDLSPVYRDIFLTETGDNPHTLLTREDDLGNVYGKFRYSLYTPYSYELDIENVQQTGIQQVPITTLDGEDASLATAAVPNSTRLRALEDRFADVIRLVDYGEVVDNTDTNTTNLVSAIAAASAQGGGVVLLPAGTIAFNVLSLPAKVILKGEGKTVTILESVLGDDVITLTGDACGLMDLTLDGVSVVSGSTGIYSKAKDNVIFEHVLVKRFDTGLLWRGGLDFIWRDFDVTNCTDNVRLVGDQDTTGDSDGDMISGGDWDGGLVTESTGVGLELFVRDREVSHVKITNVDFIDNVGTDGAILIYGASFLDFDNIYMEGNTTNITISDNPDTTLTETREVISVRLNGRFIDGTMSFDGLCQDVYFERSYFDGVTFAANVPTNPVIFKDCTEIETLFTGDTTKINRFRTTQEGTVSGSTTSATPVVVYKTKLSPNEVVVLEVTATAERVNGDGYATFIVAMPFRCAGATLLYDAQTANFTAGNSLLGATSGATAVIVADTDSGTTGVLTLAEVNGDFVDNEIISESDGSGSARTNGVLALGSVTDGVETDLHLWGSNTNLPPAGWAVEPLASGQEAQVAVTGAASNTIAWAVKISETRL